MAPIGQLLGDLASSDVGPLVADRLDGNSLRSLARAGPDGLALALRSTRRYAEWPGADPVDLEAHVVHELTLSSPKGSWMNDAPPLRLPPTVRTCRLMGGNVVSKSMLLQLSAALPPGAELHVCTSALSWDRPDMAGVRVTGLDVDWFTLEEGGHVLCRDALRRLNARVDVHSGTCTDDDRARHNAHLCNGSPPNDMWRTVEDAEDPATYVARLLPFPNLEKLDLTVMWCKREPHKEDVGQWLTHCCGMRRLRHLSLRWIPAGPLPRLPRNTVLESLELEGSTGAEEDRRFAGVPAFLSCLEALSSLTLSAASLCSMERLTSLTLSSGPADESFARCELPSLLELTVTDGTSAGLRWTKSLVLPRAPRLRRLGLWWTLVSNGPAPDKDAISAVSAYPALTEASFGYGSSSLAPADTEDKNLWLGWEREWTSRGWSSTFLSGLSHPSIYSWSPFVGLHLKRAPPSGG